MTVTKSRYLKVAVVCIFVIVVFFLYQNSQFVMTFYTMSKDRAVTNEPSTIRLAVEPSSSASNPAVCKFPNLDPFDPAITKIIKHPNPVLCKEGKPTIVKRDGNFLVVDKAKIKEKLPNIKFKGCTYTQLIMQEKTDYKTRNGKKSELFTEKIRIRPDDEHVAIECIDTVNKVVSTSYLLIVQPKPKVEERCAREYKKHMDTAKPKEKLSVLLIGIDGMSRNAFHRSLNKTRSFLLNEMQAIELLKFNKVGYNTFPNVLGLLSGKMVEEVRNSKTGWGYRKPTDMIDHFFIWNDFRRAGYRTSFMLDELRVTAFHCEKIGWHNHDFVDFTNRPLTVATHKNKKVRSQDDLCVNDVNEVAWTHDLFVQVATVFNSSKTPYFGYAFSVRATHKYQWEASKVDHAYRDFLAALHNNKLLHNTLLVFFSDHGPRFGDQMYMYNGQVETHMPPYFLIFPPWFYKKYPEITRTLKINQHRLATHYDVYATLMDLINFQGETGQGDITKRGISLFKEIPELRTCGQANIPTPFCVCNSFVQTNISQELSHKLSHAFLEFINEKTTTEQKKKKCHKLYLDKILSVFSVKSETDKAGELFQLTIETSPGGGHYRGTVSLLKEKISRVGDIVRLNRYKGQVECIHDYAKQPFCMCIKKGDKTFLTYRWQY